MNKEIDYQFYSAKWNHQTPKGKEVSFTRALKLDLDQIKTRNVYKSWGDLYEDLHDHPKSLLKFKRVLVIDPNSDQIANQIASSLEKLNMPEEALVYSFKALKITPTSYGAHKNVLQRLKRLNKFEELESQSEEFLNKNPTIRNNSTFHYIQAEMLTRENEYLLALPSYRKAIEISPYSASFHFQYGMALYHETFYQEALREFDKVIELDPFHHIAYNNSAFMKYNLGNVSEAISDLESVIENNREIYATYSNMILCKYHLNPNEEVIQPYIEKLRLDIASNGENLKKIYNQDLQLAEKKLTENLDEETKEFNLRRLSGVKFVLSLIG